jgi:predicted aldo/keto reductase-like oxidoreductase
VALKQGFYDALMPSYNLSMAEECAETFAQAAEKKVGVVLMKTPKGIGGDAYFAAIPTYLETPAVTTINRSMTSFEMVNRMIEALTPAPKEEQAAAQRLARVLAEGQCAMCGACTKACPKGLPVADLVRCSDYYFTHSECFSSAEDTYREIADSIKAACDDCGACERVCKRHVPVRHHVHRATHVLA